MWTTSRSKHKVTSGTKAKRRKSFPPLMGLEQQESKSSKRGYQKVSCDWTEDPRRSRSPHDLTHFGQKHGFVCQRGKGIHWNGEKDQLARVCASAAWQRLERFLQTLPWKLVDDHGFMSTKNRNQGGNAL